MPKDLTAGEIRSLKTYCEQELHEKASQTLGISTQTLKNHLGAAYKKLDRKKAHSALYALCLQQGFDPFAALSSSSTDTESADVISESPVSDGEITGKYRESPAQDPILTQTPGNDTIPSELSSVMDQDIGAVEETNDLPPILERDAE